MTLKFNVSPWLAFAGLIPITSIQKMPFCRQKWKSDARLDGKTAIITGCNTGIGKYNVLDFYRRGCHVVMACRDLAKAEKARADIIEELKDEHNVGSIVVEKLDLSSLKSVREFAETVLKKEPKIHILVNNAGVMACPKALTEDGYELQFATNHLGHFLLTMLLLPRVIQSAPARIINVSSMAHLIGSIKFDDINSERSYSPSLAYAQSKLANILFTKELARRLEGRQVNVYALHPGVVKTEIGRHMKKNFFPGLEKVFSGVSQMFFKSVEDGTQTQLYCALDEEAGKQTGLYYSGCRVANTSPRARNMETAARLWDLSWEMVGLGEYDPFRKDPQPKDAWVKGVDTRNGFVSPKAAAADIKAVVTCSVLIINLFKNSNSNVTNSK